ncbi:MAG TPA: tetratricopeptide repeat protein [Pseudoxanthomonas sp.]
MTQFIVLAVLLTVLVLGGVLWPLWRGSRGLVIGGLLALGLATFALYRVVGTPAGLKHTARAVPATLDDAVAELQAELKRNPNEPEGWRLLGKSLAAQEKFTESRDAFAKAAKLMPDDPNLLVEAAQARLFADPQRKLDAEALALLQRALSLQPGHQRALWLLGVSQRQNGQPAEAAKTWEPLLAQVDAGTAATLREQIDGARAEAGLPPLPAPASASEPAVAKGLAVKVALDPDFASRIRLRGDTSVFIIARVPGGPPMPVAVEKHSLQELPLTVILDDGDNPMPTQKLSTLQEVELVARLSSSGNAIRQEGDMESEPVRVTLPAATPVELVLGQAGE